MNEPITSIYKTATTKSFTLGLHGSTHKFSHRNGPLRFKAMRAGSRCSGKITYCSISLGDSDFLDFKTCDLNLAKLEIGVN